MVSSTLEESCKHDRKWLCNLIQKHHHITRSEEEQQKSNDLITKTRHSSLLQWWSNQIYHFVYYVEGMVQIYALLQ